MDPDADNASEGSRALRGFRRRWARASSEPATERSEVISLHSDHNLDVFPQLFGEYSPSVADDLDAAGWQFVEPSVDHLESSQFESLKRPLDVSSKSLHDSCPVVLDPCGSEPSWRATALEAEIKRAKTNLDKLPWEVDGSVFKTRDLWQGTAVSLLDKMFTPATLGAQDVLASQVVATRPSRETVCQDLPVVPFMLKRARREPLDEDIRRLALQKFRDLVLQDPLATQLGTSLRGRFDGGSLHEDIDQSFRDAFRMKASSTLQKRASSMTRLAKLLREAGQLYPLRLSEPELYSALCNMRAAGAGATAAQHIIEALHFVDATAKLLVADLSHVVSARCRGVARDMFLGKNPLCQKQPLTVEQVWHLEKLMHTSGTVLQCILGQLLFCIHSCCRWKDAQRLKSISLESGHGESLVHADALTSKTALTMEAKTRYLPYAALGTGVSSTDWAAQWIAARQTEELECCDFVLPSFSEKHSSWVGTPMSAAEATVWLREFLESAETPFQPQLIGSHSCKTTLLTWAGRCTKLVFTPTERRLLGHHLDANMKSVMCYSRECYTSLYAKVLGMIRLIRSGDFQPDQPAIDRVVQLAEGIDECAAGAQQVGEDEAAGSDSDSSLASLESLPDCETEECGRSEQCISLFPTFPGVPETSLLVHKVSGLVHIVGEDDFLSCGRPTSRNFRSYALVSDRDHLDACRHCLRSFRNRED